MAEIIFCVLFFVATGFALYYFNRMLKAEDALSEQRRYSWRQQDLTEQELEATQRELEDTQRELPWSKPPPPPIPYPRRNPGRKP